MMVELSTKDIREDSLQTHGLEVFRSIAIECFFALNIAAFICSFSVLIVRAFDWLIVWVMVVMVMMIGGYAIVLIHRRDSIGWLYWFCVGLGSAIAGRHT